MSVEIRREGRGWLLTARTAIPRALEEVFPFFSEASNLDALTPRYLRFEIVTAGPIEMREGAVIDYRLRVRGVPVRWRRRIAEWDPPRGFVDEQVRGPYLWWRHRHRFASEGGRTVMTDEVEYGVPGGRLAHGLLVRRDLRAIFAYRARRVGEIFGGVGAVGG